MAHVIEMVFRDNHLASWRPSSCTGDLGRFDTLLFKVLLPLCQSSFRRWDEHIRPEQWLHQAIQVVHYPVKTIFFLALFDFDGHPEINQCS